MSRRFKIFSWILAGIAITAIAAAGFVWYNLRPTAEDDQAIARACVDMISEGLPDLAGTQTERFTGKVSEAHLRCRGGSRAVALSKTPWVDWPNYWGVGDITSTSNRFQPGSHLFNRNKRGIDGALMDLEIQRMELIKFNLFDNKTYPSIVSDEAGPVRSVWPEMRLPKDHPHHEAMQIDDAGNQLCRGALIRFRTLTGICNDIRNPVMGSSGQPFARNVAFEATFPKLGLNELARNRHGDRIDLLKPDPQVISRRLFTRDQTKSPNCALGKGVPGSPDADCSYQKAPFFNVLAAFWIQFMTHDWFAHLDEARNDRSTIMNNLGCQGVGTAHGATATNAAGSYGCRPEDKMEAALFADSAKPDTFRLGAAERLARAPKTSTNFVTAWWDGSQVYGWNEASRRRVLRDPEDRAKLLLVAEKGAEPFLPMFHKPCTNDVSTDCLPMQPEWSGQEVVAFPDNWSIGLSFYHNLFAREHNAIINEFRRMARDKAEADSGLRHPDRPDDVIPYSALADDELFEIARLVVTAEIAKIHTIEWTTQLLYNEALNLGMHSNWSGLFENFPVMAEVSERLVKRLEKSSDPRLSNQLYSAFAAGAGIIGRGNSRWFPPYVPQWMSWDRWSITEPTDVNGGTNHFGSPFNFPEGFPSVYRLHALLPDMLEYRELNADPNAINERLPVVETFRGLASGQMRGRGMPNMALTMGRQRLGLLVLQNHPQFLQNLDLRPRLDTMIDVAALDLIRDRERGTPRFNEFRRQIGLQQLTSFDDFIDQRLPEGSAERARQEDVVKIMREVYGQHKCDAAKVITDAQLHADGDQINDCLGHPDGSLVDNIEDVDLVVGYHAETTRPHGFAISETQFHVFILNASRRLFSDRFFTSSFRPEFYTHLGINWVKNNGPSGKQWEQGEPNGHRREVSPLKRILLRAMPELQSELDHVVNVFDPWARDRGEYYSIDWIPRPGAESDEAFEGWEDHSAAGGSLQWQEAFVGGSPATENETFEGYARTIGEIQEKTRRCSDSDDVLRAFHAKSIVGVRNATLRFRDDLPASLRSGFAQPGALYPAIVRISNASGTAHADGDPDMRGFALRVVVSDGQSHDLLMTNQAVSHARNAEQFVVFADALTCGGVRRVLGLGALAWEFGPSETLRMVRHVQAGRKRQIDSLALETFWSRGAIRWGDALAVRYLLRPTPGTRRAEKDDEGDPDYLRREFAERLRSGSVSYQLLIQPFVDEIRTPIEDGAIEWKETASRPILIATLTMPSHDLLGAEAQAVRASLDDLSFNPWRTPDEFRPLGNMNRARKLVYQASSRNRGAVASAGNEYAGTGN
jgi:hypothetical protein